ncbi:dirigent protein 23-like [Abrus precatorius]|uniref:Dirigent protein n=1 Tax=Abrus precatorius TaxID=3816 RepID=A0A8B8KW97_ABRPR|nr:dirigent protein 23-like [Abrus precatorius]
MAPSISAPTKFLSFSFLLISIIVYQTNGQLPIQTTMVLYLQDIARGPNATVAPVIGLSGRDWSYNSFGTIFVVDDPVMMSANPSSPVVGRAQGMLVVSAQDGANVNVVLSIVFNNMQYSDSTLELQGISRQRQDYKEVSVVSGTGRFRFARGFAALQTAYYDPQTTHSVVRLTINLAQTR